MTPRTYWIRALVLSISLVPLACKAITKEAAPPAYPPLESAELGGMHNVSVCNGFWLGGKPSRADLDLARRRGIERVIDLCTPGERPGFDVSLSCHELDLEFHDIALRSPDRIPEAAVDRVMQLLGEEPPVKTLLFCSDGSRSAMFFGIHRVIHEGLEIEKALLEARRSGMPSGASEDFVRKQVERLTR